MASRKDWDVIPRISGNKANRGGMSVGNAFTAGIKREVPTPKYIQDVADSIKPADDAPAKPSVRKSPLIAKYNVEGDTASMSSEMFRGIFTSQNNALNGFKKLGVKTLKISTNNVDIDFEIYDESQDDSEWRNCPHIGTRDIMTLGVAQAVGLHEKVILSNQTRIIGFLRVNTTDRALAMVGAGREKADFHTTEWGKMGEINAQAIFKDSATVESAAFHYKLRGGVNLNYIFKDSANKFAFMIVGTLLHPDLAKKHGVDITSLRQIQIQHVASMLASTKADTQEQLISDVFREAVHGYALYAATNYDVDAVAIFIPAKIDLQQNSDAPTPPQQ